MAYWGGMGGGGMMGGMHGMGGGGGPGLRRSVDAWDDQELGAAYNHEVVMRVAGYVKPYKMRALLSITGVVLAAVLINIQPNVIGNAIDAASRGDTGAVTKNGILFLCFALGGWLGAYMQLLNAGWIGHRILLKMRTEMFAHLQRLSQIGRAHV